jgi:hypothetical protein
VVHAAALLPNGVDHHLRRNLFTINSLLAVYENSPFARETPSHALPPVLSANPDFAK